MGGRGAGHLGRAGGEEGGAAAHGQRADVGRVKAVHVLLQADGVQDALLVDVLWQRQLHQDAVHILIRIVIRHHL